MSLVSTQARPARSYCSSQNMTLKLGACSQVRMETFRQPSHFCSLWAPVVATAIQLSCERKRLCFVDGWMHQCLSHCHSSYHGWGSITSSDLGTCRTGRALQRHTCCSFLLWPSGFDEQTRFIPSPILTTDSNRGKEINLITATDGLFEHCFSIVTLSSLIFIMS